MRKDLVWTVFALMLAVSACQAPVQTTNPDGSLTKQEYSKRFVSLYKDFNKSNAESAKSSAKVLGTASSAPSGVLLSSFVPTSSGPTVTGASSSNPAQPSASASAMPTNVSDALAALKTQIEAFKVIFKAASASSVQMETRLKELKPPAEMTEKHNLALEFFGLTRELSESMLKDLDAGDPLLLMSFSTRYKDKTEKLTNLRPQVLDLLFDFSVETYRQDRLALQKGGRLSRNEYLLRMRSLLSKLPSYKGASETWLNELIMPHAVSIGADHASSDVKSLFTKAVEKLSTVQLELSSLHPPEDFEAGHTAIYASTRLQIDVLSKAAKAFGNQEAMAKSNEQALAIMMNLFSDVALLDQMMDLEVFMPKAKIAQESLNRG